MDTQAASKADLTGEIAAVRADLAETKSELKADVFAVKSDLRLVENGLRAEMRQIEQRLVIKLGGMLMVVTGLLLASIRYLPATPPGH